MDFEEAYRIIVRASKEQDTKEILTILSCFDFKNEDIGDKKGEVDEFLGNKIHNLRDGFYCLYGEK